MPLCHARRCIFMKVDPTLYSTETSPRCAACFVTLPTAASDAIKELLKEVTSDRVAQWNILSHGDALHMTGSTINWFELMPMLHVTSDMLHVTHYM